MSGAEDKPEPDASWREPKTVTLKLADGSTSTTQFDRTPYVLKNRVYIYPGESFSIALAIQEGKIVGISYDKDGKARDRIELKFEQSLSNGKHEMMMLIARNKTNLTVLFNAYMLLPKREKHIKTSILPLEPGLSGYESWADPITQLVLCDFRIVETPSKK